MKSPLVLVFGLGVSGCAAIAKLNSLGITNIIGFDISVAARNYVSATYKIQNCFDMNHFKIFEKGFITDADIVIGSVLIPGKEAPIVLDQEFVRNMPIKLAKKKIFADIAIDQGGCLIEHSPITSHLEPVKKLHNKLSVIAVPNLPAAKPAEASKRLSDIISDYVIDFFAGNNKEVFEKALTKSSDVIIPL
jgi:alanine dehydrogenase